MKILYAGSPEPACESLKILFEKQKECGFQIVGVLSNPPSAKGRHKDLIPTPVAAFAAEKGLPVFTPEHLDSDCRAQIQPLGANLLVSFAYGHIFGPKFLAMFDRGGMNLHPSLLPKYRGCTPVPAAILNRDSETAVTVQTLALGMDEGDILAQEIVELNGSETSQSLLDYSAKKGADLICSLLEKVSALPEGEKLSGHPQSGDASYTGIIKKEDGKIDWSEDGLKIEAKIRAYFPEPGCWCMEKGLTLRILSASFIADEDERALVYKSEAFGKVLAFVKAEGIYIKVKGGILCARILQRQGKKEMGYKDFMNGARDFIGTQLE
ncbi:MAG: methionyl-tRNA formyltransferase [Treponema sp.]|nr:methionyl-tRNA formyltransferase [Treponema sp.]